MKAYLYTMLRDISHIIKIFNESADRYHQKYADVSPYGDGLDFFLRSLVGDRPAVLDLACGPGNVAAYLMTQNTDIVYHGLDLSVAMVDLASRYVPKATFTVADARSLANFSEPYNGVVCSFLLPYLQDQEVEQLIEDVTTRLVVGGCIYISTMVELDEDYGKKEPQKMETTVHAASRIREILEDHGFSCDYAELQPFDYGGGVSGSDLVLVGVLRWA